MKNKNNEAKWNEDLIKKLQEDFKEPNIRIAKGKVLRDIYITHEKCGFKLQLGFFDQDIIIYTDTMDISDYYEVTNIKIHNTGKKKEIYIPRIICELKYDGINTHGLITYSDIASDVKSIFPLCKYILLLRYKNNSSDDKLLRNGKTFDKILCFDDGASKNNYNEGDFKKELKNNKELQKKYKELLNYFKNTMKKSHTHFTK